MVGEVGVALKSNNFHYVFGTVRTFHIVNFSLFNHFTKIETTKMYFALIWGEWSVFMVGEGGVTLKSVVGLNLRTFHT